MKWQKDWRKILKTYSFIGLLGNLLIAFPVLLTSSLMLGVIGLAVTWLLSEASSDLQD